MPGEVPMRIVVNTIANVTTSGMSRNQVRTITAGVDALGASFDHLRPPVAPAPQQWDDADGQKPFAGKQKPAGTGPLPGSSELLSRSIRESSRCRRPRVWSCLERS